MDMIVPNRTLLNSSLPFTGRSRNLTPTDFSDSFVNGFLRFFGVYIDISSSVCNRSERLVSDLLLNLFLITTLSKLINSRLRIVSNGSIKRPVRWNIPYRPCTCKTGRDKQKRSHHLSR